MSSVEEYQELLDDVNDFRETIARNSGKKEALMAELEKKSGFKTVKKAEKWLVSIEDKCNELREQLQDELALAEEKRDSLIC